MKVLVCNDLPDENQDFESAIDEARLPEIEISRLSGADLKEQLGVLINSADAALHDEEGAIDLAKTSFDEADVVILDNNLAHLGIEGARLTAEAVAGYIRAFSSAPYIVSINKNPDVDFDMRFLIGDYATRTDLALNAHHLSNPALWTRDRESARGNFLPWYWPALLEAGDHRRKQIEFVVDHLRKPVCEAIGFSADDFASLSRRAQALLSQAEEEKGLQQRSTVPSGASGTFREVFLASSRSLPNKVERKRLDRRLENGDTGAETVIARAVAADIDLWFRRDVLGPQEVLVDLPHLLMRMPFLLGGNASDQQHWNAVVNAGVNGPPFGLDRQLFDKHLKRNLFNLDAWSTRPCFWWPRLRDDDALNAHFSVDDADWADVVFCEDRSEFLQANLESGRSPPTEFVAEFEGSWNRRYVAVIAEVKYVPKTRFAR